MALEKAARSEQVEVRHTNRIRYGGWSFSFILEENVFTLAKDENGHLTLRNNAKLYVFVTIDSGFIGFVRFVVPGIGSVGIFRRLDFLC